ncbi:hypothetical protein ACA910_000822 [Epithemia clementina (nom. ined.)]
MYHIAMDMMQRQKENKDHCLSTENTKRDDDIGDSKREMTTRSNEPQPMFQQEEALNILWPKAGAQLVMKGGEKQIFVARHEVASSVKRESNKQGQFLKSPDTAFRKSVGEVKRTLLQLPTGMRLRRKVSPQYLEKLFSLSTSFDNTFPSTKEPYDHRQRGKIFKPKDNVPGHQVGDQQDDTRLKTLHQFIRKAPFRRRKRKSLPRNMEDLMTCAGYFEVGNK